MLRGDLRVPRSLPFPAPPLQPWGLNPHVLSSARSCRAPLARVAGAEQEQRHRGCSQNGDACRRHITASGCPQWVRPHGESKRAAMWAGNAAAALQAEGPAACGGAAGGRRGAVKLRLRPAGPGGPCRASGQCSGGLLGCFPRVPLEFSSLLQKSSRHLPETPQVGSKETGLKSGAALPRPSRTCPSRGDPGGFTVLAAQPERVGKARRPQGSCAMLPGAARALGREAGLAGPQPSE